MGGRRQRRWQFWIDRGGTFTDCIGVDPFGEIRVTKVLSDDLAPLRAIRQLLDLDDDASIPPCDVRMGTTIATNALLERRGAVVDLIVSRGFADLLEIGDQTRPDLFALDIVKHVVLADRVIEVDARINVDGSVRDGRIELPADLRHRSAAISILGSHRNDELEKRAESIARGLGAIEVSRGASVRESGYLARTGTAVVDAFTTPLLRAHVEALSAELPSSELRLMQSSGGLTDGRELRGKNAILSGPAGGVVACADVARASGFTRAIGFDMGGTSTDVVCIDGELERDFETVVAGVKLRTPMLSIHTVAAGGGSLCRYRGHRLTVGPESAGAIPGPACYGHAEAREPTITDVNVVLGRAVGDRFPFDLAPERSRAVLEALRSQMPADSRPELMELCASLLAIANHNMAEAIRTMTVGRGRDPREFALVVYGGAGGQHACAVADALGISTVIVDPLAGVLSAFGIGIAPVSATETEPATFASMVDAERRAIRKVRERLAAQGFDAPALQTGFEMRYRGTEQTVLIHGSARADELVTAFTETHRARFGYVRDKANIEVVAVRVRGSGELPRPSFAAPGGDVGDRRTRGMWIDGEGRPVSSAWRESLTAGQAVQGPALILESTGTTVVDPGWRATMSENGRLILTADAHRDDRSAHHQAAETEIFANLFMSIASQMGAALERTAISTNIRERRDFSCAIFDAHGDLVANAPHIPVHLGAMSESVKALLSSSATVAPGDVFATNDPSLGGSHLPDITVITPVFGGEDVPQFFTASRGHHVDVGGKSPGSMPADSSSLDEEGVVFRMTRIVSAGRFDVETIGAVLRGGRYPCREPETNLADLRAQVAANQAGVVELQRASKRFGAAVLARAMARVQDNAARRVGDAIEALEDGTVRFADLMDDGAEIKVALTISGRNMRVDFTGSSGPHDGNLNAPRAVAVAAVIYTLRALVGAPIPLNSGCLRTVEIIVPSDSILDPPATAAVVGGNVETSQRLVDVLFGALGLSAASQGTMNNVTFGDESFGYYETICGGAGATPNCDGASAVHTHMTNTRITDPETVEERFPLRIVRFEVRRGSGGSGARRGGDGVIREFETQAPVELSILSERRARRPFGLRGGAPGGAGNNCVDGRDLGGRVSVHLPAGSRVVVKTPGGGGFGST